MNNSWSQLVPGSLLVSGCRVLAGKGWDHRGFCWYGQHFPSANSPLDSLVGLREPRGGSFRTRSGPHPPMWFLVPHFLWVHSWQAAWSQCLVGSLEVLSFFSTSWGWGRWMMVQVSDSGSLSASSHKCMWVCAHACSSCTPFSLPNIIASIQTPHNGQTCVLVSTISFTPLRWWTILILQKRTQRPKEDTEAIIYHYQYSPGSHGPGEAAFIRV